MKTNIVGIRIAKLDGQDLEAHIGDNAIALLREQMDAKALIDAIGFLSEMSTELTVALACACGECKDYGDCYDDDEDGCPCDCDQCDTPCSGVEIPACMLEEAGIDPKVGLQFDTRDGEIIIRELDDEWGDDADGFDITDHVPEGLLTVLSNSNVCIDRLWEMLESGEIVYG